MRPEVTSGLATGAAVGVWNLSSAREPSNGTAAVECCYRTPTGTQASGTPLCSPGREDKSLPVQDKLN